MLLITGVGLTTMVKLFELPVHPLAVVFTVIIAVTGDVVVLIAVNAAISPDPEAARPIVGSVLVQLKVVPDTDPVKWMAAVISPLHLVWLDDGVTSGVGFTVSAKLVGVPKQPFNSGVTVITPNTGTLVALAAINAPISPDPVAGRPMEGLALVQPNVVPVNEPVNVTAVVDAPLHTV